jgi:two-component system osmolarity sensor histidine kinase EnvZ
LVLLIAFSLVVQFATIAVYMLLQRPRVIEQGVLVATQINTLNVALSRAPPSVRDDIVQQINRDGQIIIASDTQPPVNIEGSGMLMKLFLNTVRLHVLPQTQVRWEDDPSSRLWASAIIEHRRYWIVLPVRILLRFGWLSSTLMLLMMVALMATIVALLIQRRINRPLKEIAEVARKLGEGGQPDRLPNYSSIELATVASQFNMMTDSLEAMESSRAVMLAGISHDIRTPLTKLRLALAIEQRPSEEPVSRYIDQIDLIVGQFLDYARTGSDEPATEGDLNTLILQLAGEFEERGYRFELKMQKLPPFQFRSIAMLRVVRNLMENAVKYGVRGLEVVTWHKPDEIGFSVLDRGPGIPAADCERLLRPFIRADTARSTVSGTGLGLAIVDRIVRLHGGRLCLTPRSGGGLAANVALPLFHPGGTRGEELSSGGRRSAS